MNNTFGQLYTLTSFGESHGPALGGVIDGCPAGIKVDFEAVDRETARRRPGQSHIVTGRSEADKVTFLSGILNGVTTGAPIGFCIENTNTRSEDYSEIARAFRPNHADYTYYKKYNGFNDIRGGGRSSARETVSRIVAGELARQVLAVILPEMSVTAYTQSVGDISLDRDYTELDLDRVDSNVVRCPDGETARRMEGLITAVKAEGDTVGGTVRCVVRNCPVGIGEPVFDKLSARLASAMMSINAAKGFEIGMGFAGTRLRGSQAVDTWTPAPDDPRGLRALSNRSGGIQGGLSNGEDIVMTVAFKPVATLLREIDTVDTNLDPVVLKARGRHDPCVVPRAVPIVEAMARMVLLDLILIDRARRL